MKCLLWQSRHLQNPTITHWTENLDQLVNANTCSHAFRPNQHKHTHTEISWINADYTLWEIKPSQVLYSAGLVESLSHVLKFPHMPATPNQINNTINKQNCTTYVHHVVFFSLFGQLLLSATTDKQQCKLSFCVFYLYVLTQCCILKTNFLNWHILKISFSPHVKCNSTL